MNTNKEHLSMLVDWLEDDLNKIIDNNFDKYSSVTNKGGRPYILSPRELTDSMIAYFRRCIINDYPFTVTGLSQQLGITRRGLLRLEKSSNDRFVPIIEKGKQVIESYLEIQCHLKQNPRLPIFILKKMGWKDVFIAKQKLKSDLLCEDQIRAMNNIKNY